MTSFLDLPDDSAILGRRLLLGSALATAGAIVLDEPTAGAQPKPLALIYRGPAADPDAAAAAASAIRRRGVLQTGYVGPRQPAELSAAALQATTLYVQPGGGSVEAAWPHMAPYRRLVVEWVRGGGHYLGLCLGGYLAADDPGFGLWPGRIFDYKSISGADVRRDAERLATITWRRRSRVIYVEDPPTFTLDRSARRATVIARYRTGHLAAASVPLGRGRVTVVGPHPEAPPSWSSDFGGPSGWDATAWDDLERTALA